MCRGVAKSLNFRMCFGHLKAPTFTGRCLGTACMHTMVDFSQITFWLSSSVLWIIWDDNRMRRSMISEGKLLIFNCPGANILTIPFRLDLIPRWKDLNHFNSLKKSGEYTDGTKFEDLSKVSARRVLFYCCNI
jgi:hypothetical protein